MVCNLELICPIIQQLIASAKTALAYTEKEYLAVVYIEVFSTRREHWVCRGSHGSPWDVKEERICGQAKTQQHFSPKSQLRYSDSSCVLGGLKALIEIFVCFTSELSGGDHRGAASGPQHPSQLAEILDRHTRESQAGRGGRHNCFRAYIAAPNKHLLVNLRVSSVLRLRA